MLVALAILLFFGTPIAAILLEKKTGASWLDPVLVCYAVGFVMANVPIAFNDHVANEVASAVVPLAIPLLLFETDILKWAKGSRNTIVAFVIAVLASLIVLPSMFMTFEGQHAELASITGMLTGTWIGGSPNLLAVGAALGVGKETLATTNIADVVVGGIYLLMLLTFARPLLGKVFPPPENPTPMIIETSDLTTGQRFKQGVLSLLLALLILGFGVGVSLLVAGKIVAPWVILTITTGGVAASFLPKIRELKASYEVGNYLILVFCVAIGSLTDLSALATTGSFVLMFTAVSLVSAIALHFTVCRLLKIDVDTTIITSVATVMGPPLVVPVARRLNNQEAFVSGVTTGLVGYALGNYLGIAMFYALTT